MVLSIEPRVHGAKQALIPALPLQPPENFFFPMVGSQWGLCSEPNP